MIGGGQVLGGLNHGGVSPTTGRLFSGGPPFFGALRV